MWEKTDHNSSDTNVRVHVIAFTRKGHYTATQQFFETLHYTLLYSGLTEYFTFECGKLLTNQTLLRA